jgi:phage/conjugal plasmid C-4 type zinc finger TraR family protein
MDISRSIHMADIADCANDTAELHLGIALDSFFSVRNDGVGNDTPYCHDCGDLIPEARMRAIPGVKRCIHCQSEHEAASRVWL